MIAINSSNISINNCKTENQKLKKISMDAYNSNRKAINYLLDLLTEKKWNDSNNHLRES